MNVDQQQPMVVNPDDIFAKMFGDKTPPTEEIKETELPNPPKQEEVTAVKEEEKTTIVEEQPKPSSDYTKKLQTLIETKFIEDFSINFNGEEKFLSEIEVEDESVFNEIVEKYKAEQDTKLKERYISREGLDETTEKLIEIKKAGGSIQEIFKENVSAIETLQNLKNVLEEGEDKQKEQIAINILVQDLRQRGISDGIINAQINEYISGGILEAEAEKILTTHLQLHKDAIEQKRVTELQRVDQEKEEAKTFKKTLNQQYKGWDIPENIAKVLVENATKTDEFQISNTDNLYFQARKNPELYAKINFFLNNPQEFEKWISGKKVLAEKIQTAKSSITIDTSKVKDTTKKTNNFEEEVFGKMFNKP
jgi:hypothetical protein